MAEASTSFRCARAALLSFAAFVSLSACDSPAAPEPLHPSFTFTAADLAETAGSLHPADAARILARPQVFLEQIANALAGPPELLWLIDRTHPLPADHAPPDLIELSDYDISVNRNNHRLRRLLMPDLLAMNESARAAGRELVVSSSYRSFEQQRATYAFWVERDGQVAADRYSAQPGHSQHQLGTAIDFGSIRLEYGDSDNGRWVHASAWQFGFSLSYPNGFETLTGYSYEPWHFRYLSRAGTALEREFFGGIQQRLLEFFTRHGGELRAAFVGPPRPLEPSEPA